MAEILTKDEIAALGGAVEYDEPAPARIQGLETLVSEMRALVSAQRAAIGVGGDNAAGRSDLIRSIKLLAEKAGSGNGRSDMTQKVLEGMLTQLAKMPKSTDSSGLREPNPVYVFDIQRSTMGYITKIVATPQPAGV